MLMFEYDTMIGITELDSGREREMDYLGQIMSKPVYAIFEQQRCRSACASVQSDQCFCFSLPR